MPQHALLIATHDTTVRDYLAGQFEADGHTVHPADSAATTSSSGDSPATDGNATATANRTSSEGWSA